MQFLHIKPDGSRVVRGHPGWRTGETPERARLLIADELVDMGFGLKVVDEPPPSNPATQERAPSPIADWSLDARTATVTYTVTDLSAEEIRNRMPALTPRQLCLMLPYLGLTEAAIEAKIAAIADPDERQYADVEWRKATYCRRNHPLLISLAADLVGVPPEQLDTIWLYAANL